MTASPHSVIYSIPQTALISLGAVPATGKREGKVLSGHVFVHHLHNLNNQQAQADIYTAQADIYSKKQPICTCYMTKLTRLFD